MSLISKNNCCANRSIVALLSAYQEYLVTFKLMTSQTPQGSERFLLRFQKRTGFETESQGIMEMAYSMRRMRDLGH